MPRAERATVLDLRHQVAPKYSRLSVSLFSFAFFYFSLAQVSVPYRRHPQLMTKRKTMSSACLRRKAMVRMKDLLHKWPRIAFNLRAPLRPRSLIADASAVALGAEWIRIRTYETTIPNSLFSPDDTNEGMGPQNRSRARCCSRPRFIARYTRIPVRFPKIPETSNGCYLMTMKSAS